VKRQFIKQNGVKDVNHDIRLSEITDQAIVEVQISAICSVITT